MHAPPKQLGAWSSETQVYALSRQQALGTQSGSLWHEPPPMTGHVPQSPGQVMQSSPESQTPLPQAAGHCPQSAGQLLHVSVPLQVPSPQAGGHVPQSAGQLLHVSVPVQIGRAHV